MSIDEINDAQEGALSTLRAKIEARKAAFVVEESVPFPSTAREMQQVPDIVLPDDAEFQYDRYIELMLRLEVLFNNYLVFLLSLREELTDQTKQEGFETALKELCRAQDAFISEGLKPRF